MSDTPLFSALSRYAARSALRMHMPGHKGKSVFPDGFDVAAFDVTELADTGCLYEDAPPFSEANRLAASAWRVPQAMILAGGATLGIQAMLRCAFDGAENRRILVDRGSHKSVYHAMAMLDLNPTYLFPDQPGRTPFAAIGASFSPAAIDRALNETKAHAVILTSPTYYGTVHDLAAIAEVVHRHGALLCVDEAHGAHLPFLDGCSAAVALGADMAVCSLHKTLPALTGAALLTFSAASIRAELARAAACFGSSSPSFLIAASADCARAAAETADFDRTAAQLAAARDALAAAGLPCLTAADTAFGRIDPLRLTVYAASAGLSGTALANAADANGVVAEMSDCDHVVCIVTPGDTETDLTRLVQTLSAQVPAAAAPKNPAAAAPITPCIACRPREAWMRAAETVPLAESAGRIAAETVGRYPPGIPLVAPGETVTDQVAAAFAAEPDAFPPTIRVLCRNG